MNLSSADLAQRAVKVNRNTQRTIKALTALVGQQLSLSVGWDNDPEPGQDCKLNFI